VNGSIDGTTVSFDVSTPSAVDRGVILFLASENVVNPGQAPPASTAWTHVELSAGPAGHLIGSAPVPTGTQQVQYTVQLKKGCNVAVSSNKARLYSAAPLTQAFHFNFPAPGTNGVYAGPTVTGTISGTGAFTVTVNGTPQSCTNSCTVSVSGNGANIVVASAGSTSSTFPVIIDRAPTITVTSPTSGQRVRQGASVSTSANCATSGPNVALASCDGPATLDTTTKGNQSVTFTAADQFGLTGTQSVPYYVDGTPPQFSITSSRPTLTNATTATFYFSATDPDDTSAPVALTCQLDSNPAVACASPYTVSITGSSPDGVHTFSVTATDVVGNAAVRSFDWTVDTTSPVFTSMIVPADPSNDATPATFSYIAADANGPLTFACTIDRTTAGTQVSQACSSTGATVSGLAARTSAYTFIVSVTDGAGNTTSTPYSWHVYAQTKVMASGVITTLPQLTAKLTRSDGTTGVAGQVVRFTLGTSGIGNAVSCTNGTGNAVTTASDGTATCQISLTDLLLQVVPAQGFTATYAGVPPYFGSSGSAGVL
jgi:hypothetical protein